MLRKLVPLLVVGATAGLTMAAIELLPQTLLFPIVDFFAPGGLHTTFLQPGRTSAAACELVLDETASALSALCRDCRVVRRCARGLPAAQRQVLTREPLAQPSARSEDGGLTVVFSAQDPAVAMNACRQTERWSDALRTERRLRCYPAGAPR
jgi:hypothetical protein